MTASDALFVAERLDSDAAATQQLMAGRGVVFWDFDGTLGFGPHGPGAWAPCLVEALDELHPGHNVTVDELRPFTRGRYPWSTPERSHTHIQTATEWWDELEPVFRTAFEGVGFAETASALANAGGPLLRRRRAVGLVR